MSDAVGRLRQLGDNATGGPWAAVREPPLYDAPMVHARRGTFVAECADDPPDQALGMADAEFIAAARNVWDALLDVAEAAGQAATENLFTDDFAHRMADLRAALDRLDKETPA